MFEPISSKLTCKCTQIFVSTVQNFCPVSHAKDKGQRSARLNGRKGENMFEEFIYKLVGMYRAKTLKLQGFEDFKSTI